MATTKQEFQVLRATLMNHVELLQGMERAVKWHGGQVTQLRAAIAKAQAECEHVWKYQYTGKHGSDKGDDYYTCMICDKNERRP